MNRDEHLDAVEHAALQLKHVARGLDFCRRLARAKEYFGCIPEQEKGREITPKKALTN